MNTRSKVSPPAADPNDDEDLDMLDEFSISSILNDGMHGNDIGDEDDTINSFDPLPDLRDADGVETVFACEPTIDELLDCYGDDGLDETQRNPATTDTGTFGPREIMLPPEVLFPKKHDK